MPRPVLLHVLPLALLLPLAPSLSLLLLQLLLLPLLSVSRMEVTSDRCLLTTMNIDVIAQRRPLWTRLIPWIFSQPEEKNAARPTAGSTSSHGVLRLL